MKYLSFIRTFIFPVALSLRISMIFCLLLASFLIACSDVGLIEPLPVTNRDKTPCNLNATKETKAVLRYLATLSEDPFQGAIVGQNCGHTGDIYNTGHLMSYSRLVEGLYTKTGKWVGILGVDYEHDEVYTAIELSTANQVLIDYWNAGGLIAVGMSPHNPWLNDESDPENNPGNWKNTRTTYLTSDQLAMIDLTELTDFSTDIGKVWKKKLDRIATALLELQSAGVVVLFKPMQEHNGHWFWWGYLSHENDPGPYIYLYRHIYDYFTNEKGLNNLLWMYSPSNNVQAGGSWLKAHLWGYPGDDYVDIVAPTSYTHSGTVYGYAEFIATGKPFALAEYGPDHDDNYGTFDNRTYIRRIRDTYTGAAFWISWGDWDNGDGTNTYMSLYGNLYEKELMNDEDVITRDRLQWKDFLE